MNYECELVHFQLHELNFELILFKWLNTASTDELRFRLYIHI